TLRALKVKIETAVITKSSAEKLTADTLVSEEMTLQELTADTVTGQKVEAAQMVTDTMYSSKVQTDKIETTQEVKVGTEIVIDGTTGKIATSTINANNLAITGQASLSQLHVADSIKIGNSVWIGGINTNLPASYNHIYSDDGYLSVQCKKFDLNTIINAYNNGKVGIGTYNPKTKLDINGQVYIRNGNNAAVIYFPRTGNFPNFYIRSDDNPSTYEADRDRLFIGGEDGNVGIGTTSPGKKLDVSGTIRASNELISTSTGIAQARFICSNYGVIHRNDGTNYYILLTALNDPYGYWNTFRPFRINIASGNVYLGKNALTIEHSTGNIGVGTTTPKTRLHVKTDSTNIWMGTTQSHFVDGYNNGGAIYLGAAYGGTDMTCGIEASWGGVGFTTPQMGIGLIRGGVGPHILMKAPGGGSGAGIMSFKNGTTTNMIITPAGQVGIGTTCPDEKLCVNGIVKSNIEFIVTEYDGWCDFAFNKDYIRMNWKEKVKFYTDSLHLPGIDPGKKIETEGLKISKTMAGLMLNVEENRMDITDLYIMYEELKKEFDELKKENADLKRYIELKSKK
ncbi:MAG: hypothetical protein HY738_21560, partial [Bacteroidia bacterium]|nr:hypothetical protein [Bacteroidia bacterium]